MTVSKQTSNKQTYVTVSNKTARTVSKQTSNKQTYRHSKQQDS